MILQVPYVKQVHRDACGAAAIEMVYRYYHSSKLTKFNQRKILERWKEPCSSGRQRIATANLVRVLQERRLKAGWGRLSPDLSQCKAQLGSLLDEQKTPIVACQRMNDEFFSIGHYRVVIGLTDKAVVFHDPCGTNGGKELQLPWLEFLDLSRPTPGGNVTGGVAIWASEKELREIPLLPDLPNPWIDQIWLPKDDC